jgi:hypothetical protein
MQAQLPSVSGTDGAVLLDQAKHGFVRDMITRTEVWWPRYGVGNAEGTGYEQAGHSNGKSDNGHCCPLLHDTQSQFAKTGSG